MKKRIVSIVLAILSCVIFLVGCGVLRSDTEKIEDRIEKFEKNYNNGDFEALLENLTAKEREKYQALFNIMGSLAGGMLGFDIDLSDMFSLGIATQEDAWMAIKIKEIQFADETTAFAQCEMGYVYQYGTVSDIFEVYFYLQKEDGDWYVQDMNEFQPSAWKTESPIEEQ